MLSLFAAVLFRYMVKGTIKLIAQELDHEFELVEISHYHDGGAGDGGRRLARRLHATAGLLKPCTQLNIERDPAVYFNRSR